MLHLASISEMRFAWLVSLWGWVGLSSRRRKKIFSFSPPKFRSYLSCILYFSVFPVIACLQLYLGVFVPCICWKLAASAARWPDGRSAARTPARPAAGIPHTNTSLSPDKYNFLLREIEPLLCLGTGCFARGRKGRGGQTDGESFSLW